MARIGDSPVEQIRIRAYEMPTDGPESDGTLEWDSTTIVLVLVSARGQTGLGYTYADRAAASLIEGRLAELVLGQDAGAVFPMWESMFASVRNLGHSGLTQMAIAAVDVALWDLKAKLLDLPMVALLGRWHESVPVYGSGGFTSYPVDRLQDQLAGWVARGIDRVKMKVGRAPEDDPGRVAAAREAVGDDAELFVDANGAYNRTEATAIATEFSRHRVTWFEEPVTSDDLAGLRFVREQTPPGMEVTAGEYGFGLEYFKRMMEAQAVDVIQPDVTRCGGITGFLGMAPLCDAMKIPLSAHTAPSLSAHVCAAVRPLRHIEYFHDHVRIEERLLDGVLEPRGGRLIPDASKSGLGLSLKESGAEEHLVFDATQERER